MNSQEWCNFTLFWKIHIYKWSNHPTRKRKNKQNTFTEYILDTLKDWLLVKNPQFWVHSLETLCKWLPDSPSFMRYHKKCRFFINTQFLNVFCFFSSDFLSTIQTIVYIICITYIKNKFMCTMYLYFPIRFCWFCPFFLEPEILKELNLPLFKRAFFGQCRLD